MGYDVRRMCSNHFHPLTVVDRMMSSDVSKSVERSNGRILGGIIRIMIMLLVDVHLLYKID